MFLCSLSFFPTHSHFNYFLASSCWKFWAPKKIEQITAFESTRSVFFFSSFSPFFFLSFSFHYNCECSIFDFYLSLLIRFGIGQLSLSLWRNFKVSSSKLSLQFARKCKHWSIWISDLNWADFYIIFFVQFF